MWAQLQTMPSGGDWSRARQKMGWNVLWNFGGNL